MKTLRYFANTAFVVSLALFASCSSDSDIEEKADNNENTPTGEYVFSATIEDNEVTRAALNTTDNRMHWETGDKITVFAPIGSSGTAGTVTGTEFTLNPASANSTIGYFTSNTLPTLGSGANYYFAFYPHSANCTFENKDYYVVAEVPTEQKVTDGYTFDKNAMMMMAYAPKDTKQFKFKNVCALIKVTISGNKNGTVKYIKLMSNNEARYLSGKFKVKNLFYNDQLSITAPDQTDRIDVSYVQLEIPASKDDDPVDYYVVARPSAVLNAGFTLLLEGEFKNGSQKIYQRVNTSSRTLEYSKIYDLGEYNVKKLPFMDDVVDLDLPTGTIWCTKNIQGGGSTPTTFVSSMYDNGDYYAWGETSQRSNNYSSSNYTLGNDIYQSYTYKTGTTTSGKNLAILKNQYDAAHQIEGGAYCMPTYTQIDELYTKGTVTYYFGNTKYNSNYNGVMITAANGRYLWLPAGGNLTNSGFQQGAQDAGSKCNYWSRSLYMDDSNYAHTLDFYNGSIDSHDFGGGSAAAWRDRRWCGKNIRPIVKNRGIEIFRQIPSI